MNGLIVYSSLTGNTKKLAEKLADGLADCGNWTLKDLKTGADAEGYDVILTGAWVDRGLPNKKALEWIRALPPTTLGLFVTLGAMPDSEHGRKVRANLEELLNGHRNAGICLVPGLVDPAVLDRVRHMPPDVLPKHIVDQMVATGEVSRMATDEEYAAAINLFKTRLNELFAL